MLLLDEQQIFAARPCSCVADNASQQNLDYLDQTHMIPNRRELKFLSTKQQMHCNFLLCSSVTASTSPAEKLIIFSLNSSKSLLSRLSVTGSPGEQRKTAIPKSVKVYV